MFRSRGFDGAGAGAALGESPGAAVLEKYRVLEVGDYTDMFTLLPAEAQLMDPRIAGLALGRPGDGGGGWQEDFEDDDEAFMAEQMAAFGAH